MNKKLNRIWRQVTADKKRFGMMVALVAVGLLLWGRLILLEKVPRVATADPDSAETETDPSPSEVRELPTVAVDLPSGLTLNPFALRPDRYKPVPVEETGEEAVQPDRAHADELDRREALLDHARELTLQGVIQAASPFAVIDGVRVYVGDTVGKFTVIELDPSQLKVKLRSQEFPDLVVNLRMSNG